MYECFCVENYPAIISSRCHGPVYVKVSRKQYYSASRLYSSMEAMVTQAQLLYSSVTLYIAISFLYEHKTTVRASYVHTQFGYMIQKYSMWEKNEWGNS